MLPRLATTLALAFADPDRRSRGSAIRQRFARLLAAATWPAHAATLFIYIVAAQAFTLPTGDAVAFVSPSGPRGFFRRLLGAVLLAGVVATLCVGIVALTMVLSIWVTLFLLLAISLLLLVVGVATLIVTLRSPRAFGSSLALALRPPVRPYWTIQSLARDPKTLVSGLEFAEELTLHIVPVGEVVVVVAADERRARVYERFGFRRTSQDGLVLTRRVGTGTWT